MFVCLFVGCSVVFMMSSVRGSGSGSMNDRGLCYVFAEYGREGIDGRRGRLVNLSVRYGV